MPDQITRFLFDAYDVRGERVQMQQSLQEVLACAHYPEAVQVLLGEFMAAASLLSETLKFEGSLTVQARSQGEIPLIMAEADDQQNLRAICRTEVPPISREFKELLKDGQLCITVDPVEGKRYQGIVSLEADSLAEAIGGYFEQSEQLRTMLMLYCDGSKAGGFMLQELPSKLEREERDQHWQHMMHLCSTLSQDELYLLDDQSLLYRLFHEETVHVFESQGLRFNCNCSAERVSRALLAVGEEEIADILKEQGQIEVNCEFCNQRYEFDQLAISDLFDHQPAKTFH